jgi:tRNA G18 (ribose-2'-O)-methylase SpoU
MPIEHLTDPTDPRIAEYSAIPDAELVRRRGLFVAEGRLVVRRLIEGGRYRLRSLLLSEAALQSLEPLVARVDAPIYVCAADDFRLITGYNIHRGCLALAERPEPSAAENLLRTARTVVVLEAAANPDNVGGVFRSAGAFGVDAVLLSPACCDPLYRKAIRTSMAATLRVRYATLDDWPAALSGIRRAGFTVVALTPREPSDDLDDFVRRPRPDRLALVVGSEGQGLSDEAGRLADHQVRIAIDAGVDSLNLAVAASIAMYCLRPPISSASSAQLQK